MAYWTKKYVTILTRATHWMTYYWGLHVAWLALILTVLIYFKRVYWKCLNPNCNGNRRDKVALRTTCIKNVKFKIINRLSLSVCRILLHSKNLNWAAQNPRLGRMRPTGCGLDIPDVDKTVTVLLPRHEMSWMSWIHKIVAVWLHHLEEVNCPLVFTLGMVLILQCTVLAKYLYYAIGVCCFDHYF